MPRIQCPDASALRRSPRAVGIWRARLFASTVAVALAVCVSPALAQAGQSNPSAEGNRLEEVVVTAQRREESLQDVPIAVSTISRARAAALGITDISSLNARVPSLSVQEGGVAPFFYLRGMGNNGSAVNSESSVALYVDGIYLYPGFGNVLPFNGIERVEVLKGPQGTLFGRNTTGGVIQIVTRDPSPEPALEAEVGYGNYKTVTGSLYATTGVTDKLAVNVAAYYQDQHDGWGRNTFLNRKAYFGRQFSARTKAAFTPTDATKLIFGFEFNQFRSGGFETQVAPGVVGLDGQVSRLGRYERRANFPEKEDIKSYLYSLRAEQDLGFANLVSISAYRKVDTFFTIDQDATPAPVVDATLINPAHNFSQEIHLLSPPGSAINWLVGGYYFNAYAANDPIRIAGLAASPFPSIDIFSTQRTRSISVFGQASYEIFPATSLTAGLRYTDEHVRQEASRLETGGVVLAFNPDQRLNFDGFTWRLSIDHRFSPDLMAYASYNRGLKSGGVTLTTPSNLPPFQPEKVDAYEVGLKADMFDGVLRLNLATFVYKFKDIQVQRVIAGGLLTVNAARATIWGVDGDIEARLSPNFRMFGSFGYTHGEYDAFPNATGFPASALAGPLFSFDASGRTTVSTPRFTGNLGAQYTVPTSAGDLSLDVLLTHSSKRYVSPDNRLTLDAFEVVNASASWRSPDERYVVRAWVKNLFDERYIVGGTESGVGDTILPAAPRTYGLTLSAKY
jgi:iron complex outermembrane receptor protein